MASWKCSGGAMVTAFRAYSAQPVLCVACSTALSWPWPSLSTPISSRPAPSSLALFERGLKPRPLTRRPPLSVFEQRFPAAIVGAASGKAATSTSTAFPSCEHCEFRLERPLLKWNTTVPPKLRPFQYAYDYLGRL